MLPSGPPCLIVDPSTHKNLENTKNKITPLIIHDNYYRTPSKVESGSDNVLTENEEHPLTSGLPSIKYKIIIVNKTKRVKNLFGVSQIHMLILQSIQY